MDDCGWSPWIYTMVMVLSLAARESEVIPDRIYDPAINFSAMPVSAWVLGGLLSEGWSRLLISYNKSIDYYETRRRLGFQPRSSLTLMRIDLFDINHQQMLLLAGNAIYIIVTMLLFAHMKRKAQAYRLRWVLVVYDALNVLITFYVCLSIIKYKLRSGMLLCNSLANDLEGHKIARVFALFYLQKYLEFFDTWWFIMRKSFRQVG